MASNIQGRDGGKRATASKTRGNRGLLKGKAKGKEGTHSETRVHKRGV